jgi:hypothetical protein
MHTQNGRFSYPCMCVHAYVTFNICKNIGKRAETQAFYQKAPVQTATLKHGTVDFAVFT